MNLSIFLLFWKFLYFVFIFEEQFPSIWNSTLAVHFYIFSQHIEGVIQLYLVFIVFDKSATNTSLCNNCLFFSCFVIFSFHQFGCDETSDSFLCIYIGWMLLHFFRLPVDIVYQSGKKSQPWWLQIVLLAHFLFSPLLGPKLHINYTACYCFTDFKCSISFFPLWVTHRIIYISRSSNTLIPLLCLVFC